MIFPITCMDVYEAIVGVPIYEVFFVNEETIDYVSLRATLLNLMPVSRLDSVL
jgi:hypothetical protein